MTRTRTLACGAGLIVLGVAPLAADPRAPSSLRMRAASTADPPLNTDPSTYDFVGRQFYLRLGQRF